MNVAAHVEGRGGVREVFALAIPMIISSACDGVMTFTDRLFLARLGSDQMNAAMGGAVALQVLTFFFVGLTGYTTALVAQYFGASEKHSTTVAAFQAIIITVCAWPIVVAARPLAAVYFHFMHLPVSQIGYQFEYLNILAWGSLFSLLRYTLACYFTGIGKTKVVMVATITAMSVNVVLDYVLIFGKLGFPSMGVAGAAIATVIGSVCAVVMLAVAYVSPMNRKEFSVMRSFHFDAAIMRKLLYFGYPAGLEFFLNLMAFSAMVSFFHSQGTMVATATTILFNWDMVSFIPLIGIEIGVTSLVGRYMGAGEPEIAYRSAISGIKTGIFYSVVILMLFLFATEILVRVFSPEASSAVFEASVPLAVTMLRIAAAYVLLEAVLVALVGALRGAGDTHFTMVASVAAHWTFVPILYVSFNVFHLSAVTGWALLVVFFLVFCVVLIARFFGGKWKSIRVVDTPVV
ncbi:MAG TPA: MATE family efflux transporter [Bacteroidota bacterium]|nr:MATE family efflux transporter [Bacteroidota bacterium]